MHRRSADRRQHLPAHRQPRSGGRRRRSQSRDRERDRSRRDERRDDRRSGRDTGQERDRAERRRSRPGQAASSSSAPPSAASSCSNRMEFHQAKSETRISSLDSGNAPECITHRLTIGASEHGTSLLPAPSTSQSASQSASQSVASSSQSHIPDKRQAQEEKRKLLWAADPVPPGRSSVWQGLRFSDENQTTKFRKLMGMKEESGAAGAGDGLQQRQEQLFRDLDKQYSAARSVTHTQRGTGLGFGS